MDVAPTILAATGTPRPAGLAGRVLPQRDGAGGGAGDPLFTYYRSWPDGYYEAWGVRDGHTSVVRHRLGRGAPFRTEVFDLAADPSEREGRPADEADPRVARLRRWIAGGAPGGGARVEIDAETRRHLEALGYAQ
jgi:arylsulfatase A-like enzyme